MTDQTLPGLGAVQSPPDPRDWPVSAAYSALGVEPVASPPAAYRAPDPMPPVLDQGVTPQCVAYSAAGLKLWQDLRDTGPFEPDESRFFGMIHGTSDGAYPRDAMAAMLSAGYPVAGHPELAPQHRIAAYFAVPTDRLSLQQAIMALGPVVVATPWASSWFHPVNGVLPAFDRVVGGHAILAVGWDATGLRLRNSWGAGWGQRGEATMPWASVAGLWEAWKAIDAIEPRPSPGWRVRIAHGATVRLARVTAERPPRISGWDAPQAWAGFASGAPCEAPAVLRGTHSGAAPVALVTAGKFARRWVRIGDGVTAVRSPSAAEGEEPSA